MDEFFPYPYHIIILLQLNTAKQQAHISSVLTYSKGLSLLTSNVAYIDTVQQSKKLETILPQGTIL